MVAVIVFFKICLVGYLNNINSDRKLIEYCGNCLDVRLFIRYDIDEPLPWHSTISRTRQLYGDEVFLELFRKVLSLCVENGIQTCQATITCKSSVRLVNAFSVKPRLPYRSVVRRQKQKNGGKYWVGRFVIFSVQNTCGGICRHFFVCGLFYGANGVSTKKQARQATITTLSICFFISWENFTSSQFSRILFYYTANC